MNAHITIVRSMREFFQLMMTAAAIAIGWQFVGGKAIWLLRLLWDGIFNAIARAA